MKFIYYNDPGHGWIRVKRSVAQNVMDSFFERISAFSYQKGQYIYLEEDCDAALFIQCLKNKGCNYQIEKKYCNNHSSIRSYDSFNSQTL